MNFLRVIRGQRRLAEISAAAGVSIGAWSDIETGKIIDPRIRTCHAMAVELGITIDDFFVALTHRRK